MLNQHNGDWRSRVKDANQIGPFIEKRRIELGIPRTGPRGATKLLQVAKPTYTGWTVGGWTPRLDKAKRIADFLDVPLSDVVTVLVRMGAEMPDHQRVDIRDAAVQKADEQRKAATHMQQAAEIERKLLGLMPRRSDPRPPTR